MMSTIKMVTNGANNESNPILNNELKKFIEWKKFI